MYECVLHDPTEFSVYDRTQDLDDKHSRLMAYSSFSGFRQIISYAYNSCRHASVMGVGLMIFFSERCCHRENPP